MFTKIMRRLAANQDASSALLPATLIMTLGSFGAILYSSAHVYLIEQAVCREHYASLENLPPKEGGLMDESSCKIPQIQSHVASIYGLYKMLTYVPALFLAGPYGNTARRIGKKPIMLVNMASLMTSGIFFAAVCYCHRRFDMRWIYLAPFFDIAGGGWSSFTYAYISESVNQKRLSDVLYKLSAAQMVVSFLGMWLSSLLLRENVWLQIFVGFVALTISIPVCFLFPQPVQKNAIEASDSAYDSDSAQECTETSSLLKVPPMVPLAIEPEEGTIWIVLSGLTKSTLQSLCLFREMVYSTGLSQMTWLAFFMFRAGTSIDVLLVQWPSITHGWVIAQVNAITAYEMSIASATLLVLPALSHRFLKPRLGGSILEVDLFVTKISTLAHSVGIVAMGFAPGRFSYILGITVWKVGFGMTDALRSYVTGLATSTEQVEQLYLGIGTVEMLAGIIATASWSGIFSQVFSFVLAFFAASLLENTAFHFKPPKMAVAPKNVAIRREAR
ncbi:hypothetical protein B2J93_3595 [Marssonina coronariae]|uniref:MFS transporter n=1 Tax=Diplocarpon coronariae TaxID=2795749 RepID=A0A218Z3S6_9HELO|nr:hypothetical protein B2J93_3595 [Marssonina coronariae]